MTAAIALTGANGYVGGLIAAAFPVGVVMPLVRQPNGSHDRCWSLRQAEAPTAALLAAQRIDTLVHAAWDMKTASRPEAEALCVEGSRTLFRAARAAGVARLVFISTISAFAGARSVYGQTKWQVEQDVLAQGGVVLRLGLVHGTAQGGMFGTIRDTVRRSRIVPMIGTGRGPQYLLDTARLQAAVVRAVDGAFDTLGQPITLADPKPVMFRDLIARAAKEENRRVVRIPIPWPLLYGALRIAERIGHPMAVRSDSVISFIHADPAPDFSVAARLGV